MQTRLLSLASLSLVLLPVAAHAAPAAKPAPTLAAASPDVASYIAKVEVSEKVDGAPHTLTVELAVGANTPADAEVAVGDVTYRITLNLRSTRGGPFLELRFDRSRTVEHKGIFLHDKSVRVDLGTQVTIGKAMVLGTLAVDATTSTTIGVTLN